MCSVFFNGRSGASELYSRGKSKLLKKTISNLRFSKMSRCTKKYGKNYNKLLQELQINLLNIIMVKLVLLV